MLIFKIFKMHCKCHFDGAVHLITINDFACKDMGGGEEVQFKAHGLCYASVNW